MESKEWMGPYISAVVTDERENHQKAKSLLHILGDECIYWMQRLNVETSNRVQSTLISDKMVLTESSERQRDLRWPVGCLSVLQLLSIHCPHSLGEHRGTSFLG